MSAAVAHRKSAPRLVVAAGILCALAVASLRAEDAAPSPFLPPGFGEKPVQVAPPSTLDKIEFRGVLTLSGKTFVTLFDSSTKKSFTAELGETVNTIRVSDYKMTNETDTVLITVGAESRRIELSKPKIVAVAAAPLPPPGGNGQTPGAVVAVPQPPNPAGINKMSDEEVRQRMQRVAEEIRRRRAMRREMLEDNQQQQR